MALAAWEENPNFSIKNTLEYRKREISTLERTTLFSVLFFNKGRKLNTSNSKKKLSQLFLLDTIFPPYLKLFTFK